MNNTTPPVFVLYLLWQLYPVILDFDSHSETSLVEGSYIWVPLFAFALLGLLR